MKAAELFTNVEINREPRWPLMTRLVAGSFVLHTLFVAAALYVPGVRDSFYLVKVFSDVKYADQAYNKTIIGEAQIVNIAGDKFRYPEGYFAIANGAAMLPAPAPTPNPFDPVIISTYKPPPPVVTAKLSKPKPTPEASPSPSASPVASPSVNPADPSQKGEVAAGKDKEKSKEETEKELNQIAAANNIERPDESQINTRPLKDWLAHANELKTKGELDLDASFEIVIEAERDESGKLINPQIKQKTGDERLVAVAKDLVSAISDSKVLIFLKDTKQLRLTVRLDQKEALGIVETEAQTPERAKELERGYNGLLLGGRMLKKGQDEEIIYKSTRVASNGKQITVNFTMPREIAGDMLKKQVTSIQQKQEDKPGAEAVKSQNPE